MERPDLPSLDQLTEQANWLAPARAWLYDQAHINNSSWTLDLGCGYGVVTGELVDQTIGKVIGLDVNESALRSFSTKSIGVDRLCGNAVQLPFLEQSFDFLFCQLVLLWVPLVSTINEINRVLKPGGTLIAIEPDYGGMIEYPPSIETRELWIRGLEKSGGDPYVARKIPGILAKLGYKLRINLFNELYPPSRSRFKLLQGLNLTSVEIETLANAASKAKTLSNQWEQISHLPFFLITASKMGHKPAF